MSLLSFRPMKCLRLATVAILSTTMACHLPSKKRDSSGPDSKTIADALEAARLPSSAASARPASTGKEMPKGTALTPDRAMEHVKVALAEAAKPNADCNKVLHELDVYLPVSHAKSSRADEKAYEVAGECAEAAEKWGILRDIAIAIHVGNPNQIGDVMMARALTGTGHYKDALQLLESLEKADPKDPEVAVAYAALLCRMGMESEAKALEAWDGCAKAAAAGADLNEKKNKDPDVAFEAASAGADALFHLAKFEESEKDLDIAAKLRPNDKRIKKWQKRDAIVKVDKVGIDKQIGEDVFLGLYHLYGKEIGSYRPLPATATFSIYNFTGKDLPLLIEVEIPGVTEHSQQTQMVLKDKYERFAITPALKGDYDLRALRAPLSSKVNFKISSSDGSTVYYQGEHDVTIHPRDELPLKIRINDTDVAQTFYLSAAWVTPNAKGVDAFLQKAKEHAPDKRFSGDQAASVPQVDALYQELHAEGMSYVMDPSITSSFGLVQRTRLPTEVLASKNAQCVEGQLTYATLMEAIGLRAVQFYVQGHSFVGWLANDYDKKNADWMKLAVKLPNGEQAFILETTVTDEATTLDGVMKTGVHTWNQHVVTGKELENGQGAYLVLADERRAGITPQPID